MLNFHCLFSFLQFSSSSFFTSICTCLFCHLPQNIKPLLRLPKANQMRRVHPDCSSWLTLSQVCANQREDINRLGLSFSFPWCRISGIYFPIVQLDFPLCSFLSPPSTLFSGPGGIDATAFLQRLCFLTLACFPASLQQLCQTRHSKAMKQIELNLFTPEEGSFVLFFTFSPFSEMGHEMTG